MGPDDLVKQLQAEVARLNESVDRYQQQWAENAPAVKYKQQCDALRAEVVALRAENEALQRNATAYLESAEASCCAEFVGAALRGLEVAELRIAAQMIVQAHEDGRDMQGPIDQMQRLLDAALAAKEQQP